MWRQFYLLFCCVVTFIICGLTTNFIQLVLYFTLKQVRSDYYYKINSWIIYPYKLLFMFFLDWYSECELYVYMDNNDFKKYFGKEHTYLITNHTGELDWLFLGLLSEKLNMLGNAKAYLKRDIWYFPASGLCLFLCDYIFLNRNYEKDKSIIEDKIKTLMNYPSNTFIVLAAEGTRYTEEKHELSKQFAKEKGLPPLKYHLTPKTKAFTTSLPIMQEKLKAVYDFTIVFKSNETEPTVRNVLLLGKKIKAHCYIKRIPIEDVPKSEEGASKFIHNLFVEKDKQVDSFHKTGNFSVESGVNSFEKIKMRQSYICLINAIVWYTLCVGIVFYFIMQLLLNGRAYEFLLFAVLYVFMLMFVYKVLCYSTIPKATKLNNNKI